MPAASRRCASQTAWRCRAATPISTRTSAAVRAAGTIGAYSLVDLQFGLVEKDDRFRLQFVVKNLFDESFPAQITNGGPGGSLRYLVPREADRYFGLTGRVNF